MPPVIFTLGLSTNEDFMHYYSHHIGDMISSTANLDDHQLATYMRMIWLYYQSEKPLENNIEDIAFAVRSSESTVRLLLKHYFYLDGETWRQKRCDKELSAYHAKSDKAAQSAKKRWDNANAMQTHSERNANASENHANASKTDANQEPRTKNHKPKKEKVAPLCVAVSVLLENGFDDLTAKEFIDHKARMKAPLTSRAWADHLAESARAGWTPLAAAEKVMAKSWKGFEAKYVANEAKQNQAYESPYSKSMREKYEQIAPLIAAKNPNIKKIDPNEFIYGDLKNEPKLITG